MSDPLLAGVEDVADSAAYARTVTRLRELGVRLPTITELARPTERTTEGLDRVDPDEADARNLFRVHWHNDETRRGHTRVPGHLVLPRTLTGVEAKIIVALGNRFPMIRAHKVLAAYGCLVPRLVSGRFDPTRHRAIWPSTGNYCRGGVAISRLLGCRGVAVLPEGMSSERFAWLERWAGSPDDVVRTPGTESNVKEIYDACHELANDPANVILNQFAETGNYLAHRAVTGPALERVFEAVHGDGPLRARAYVSASGSGGTLAAGDHLKARLGTKICALEALECPTLLYNGYGDHNIQGIGDKHVPLIHNVFNTDFVAAVSEAASDALNVLFNTAVGRGYLARRRGVDQRTIAGLAGMGLSSIANMLGAIKLARYLELGPEDAVLTVATDGAELYETELAHTVRAGYDGDYDEVDAAEAFGQFLLGAATDHLEELSHRGRERIFNLGYYTWVEQQGVSLEDFDARRDAAWWDGLMARLPAIDEGIAALNRAVAAG